MTRAVVMAYAGEPSRGMTMLDVIERQTEETISLVTVTPDRFSELLPSGRVDGVVCGPELDEAALQTIIDAVETAEQSVPVVDLSDAVAAVPEEVDVTHLYPTADPERAAERLLSAVRPTVGSEDRPTDVLDENWPGSAEEGPTKAAYRGLDPSIVVDASWELLDWDSRLADRLAVDAENLSGTPLETALPVFEAEELRELGERVVHTGDSETTEVEVADGEWLELRAVPGDRSELVWFIRDVSEEKQQERELAETRDRLENTLERITDAFFALDNDEEFVLLNNRAEFLLDVDAEEVAGERFWDVLPAAVSTTFYHEFNQAMETQEPTSFEEYYRPLDSWLEVNAYPSEDGLSVFLRDITEQVELQQKLESLHDTTQHLIVAESDAAIAEQAVESAVDVLDFPLAICWRFEETRRELEPLAWSDTVAERVDEVRPIHPDSGLAWDAYEDDQLRVIDSVTIVTPHSHHPGEVGSALLVPLGEYGLLGIYADEEWAFDETDTELFRILSTAVESALARADRERQLARRNERLDDFASTVSHDLRNPLHVAAARTELARDTGELDHLDSVSDALDRMETLIEDLLERARGQQDIDRQTVSLSYTAEDAWGGLDTRDATLSLGRDATFSADPTRLKQLFENLYRNAFEHVGSDVAVTVGAHDDGFYVADDGPGIPADRRDEIFEEGVTESEEGTGYGLAIVSEIAEAHGWNVEATESEDGGARFEIHHVHSLSPDE